MRVFDRSRPDVGKLASEKDVDSLIQLLQFEDPAVQLQAARALLKMGQVATPKLIDGLWHGSPVIRKGAAAILGRQGGVSAKTIIEIMYAAEQDMGKNAVEILRDMGEPAVHSLIQALDDDKTGVREGAIAALNKIGEPALKHLVLALGDRSHRVRRGIAEALLAQKWKAPDERTLIMFLIAKGEWEELVRINKPAIPFLINLLNDDYYGIRKAAASTLGKIKDFRAVPALIKTLEDHDANVQLAAVDSLGAIGDRKAIPFIAGALNAPSYEIRMAAANALDKFGWIPETDQEKVLYFVAKERWQDIMKMGARVIPFLVRALGDEYYGVRTGAASVLYDMGPKAKVALIRALNSEHPEIRKGAADVLKRKGDAAKKPRMVAPQSGTISAEMIEKGTMRGQGSAAPQVSGKGIGQKAERGARVAPISEAATASQKKWQTPQESLFPEEGPGAGQDTVSPINKDREFVPPFSLGPETKGSGQQFIPLQKTEAATAAIKEAHEEEMTRLITQLQDKDENIRIIAAEVLGKIGEQAVLPLIATLGDPSYSVRIAVADILGELGDNRATKPLFPVMDDEYEDVRIAAARALGKIGDREAVIPLLQACKDEYPKVYETAVEALTLLGAEIVPILIEALQHESLGIRSGAAAALGKMQAGEAVEPLILLFKDPNEGVHVVAADALIKIGRPAYKPLTCTAHSPDPMLRLGALVALAGFGGEGMQLILAAMNDGDPAVKARARKLARKYWSERESEAPRPLFSGLTGSSADRVAMDSPKEMVVTDAETVQIDLITEPHPLIRMLNHKDMDIQIKAALALVAMGERAVPALTEAFADENRNIRNIVGEMLGAIGEPAIMPLIAALQDPRPAVRYGAARTLGNIGDVHAVVPLIDAIGSDDFSLSSIAIEAIIKIGSPSVPYLQEALFHPSREIRTNVADCLNQIGWTPSNNEEKIPFLLAQEEWLGISSMGDAARPALEHLISDADVEVRMGVVNAFVRLGGSESVEPLIYALGDPDIRVRSKVMGILIEIGEPAVTALQNVLDSADSGARQQAAQQVLDTIKKRRAPHPPSDT